MTENTDRPEPGTPEYEEWLLQRAKARNKKLFENGLSDFDERGVISGSDESMHSTDAESFPDEIKEYTPEERKPRPVPCNKKQGDDTNDK